MGLVLSLIKNWFLVNSKNQWDNLPINDSTNKKALLVQIDTDRSALLIKKCLIDHFDFTFDTIKQVSDNSMINLSFLPQTELCLIYYYNHINKNSNSLNIFDQLNKLIPSFTKKILLIVDTIVDNININLPCSYSNCQIIKHSANLNNSIICLYGYKTNLLSNTTLTSVIINYLEQFNLDLNWIDFIDLIEFDLTNIYNLKLLTSSDHLLTDDVTNAFFN